jgi:hypothetical protein
MLVVKEYSGINETAPLVFLAPLLTIESLGLKLLMSTPAPPPYENVLANFLDTSKIDSMLSLGGVIT